MKSKYNPVVKNIASFLFGHDNGYHRLFITIGIFMTVAYFLISHFFGNAIGGLFSGVGDLKGKGCTEQKSAQIKQTVPLSTINSIEYSKKYKSTVIFTENDIFVIPQIVPDIKGTEAVYKETNNDGEICFSSSGINNCYRTLAKHFPLRVPAYLYP